MPVVSSLMGIGSVSKKDAKYCGMLGMHGFATANKAIHDADVILAAGVRFDDRATGLVKEFCPNAKILHIDIDAAEINKILPAYKSIIDDCQFIFPILSKKIQEYPPNTKPQSWLQTISTMFKEEFKNAVLDSKEFKKINPKEFITTIPQKAEHHGIKSEDIIITTDVGQHQMWAAQFYPIEKPRQFLTSGSLGTMGFGLPTALGAALANPDKRIICFSGDGSIMMNIQELATLAEHQYDVTVIVFDNGALGMVRQQQEFMYDKTYSASIYNHSTNLKAIAQGFGIISADVYEENWEEIAFPPKGAGPRFIYVPIEKFNNVYPFVLAGKANIDGLSAKV